MLKLRLLLEGRKLRVFDFDDTLAKSDALIYLTKADGTEIELDPGEYAVYKEEPGDEFDFRDFNKMLRNPRAIKQNINLLKKAMSNPQNKVTVLTARALVFPLRHFFKHQIGIEPYVVGVAGADPRLKSRWIEKHIQKGYDDIFFMDDSKKNLRAVELLRNRYPRVKIVTQLAEGKRIPRKKGQKRNSKKHSDLYTDENPKGTIHGLKFATVKDAEASVNKIKSSGRTHAHKVQAAVAMEQRAKAAGKKSAAAVYRKYIDSVKKSENVAPDHDGKAAPYGSGYEPMDEKKWSDKYKRSIDCDNPKGFSQKAHCQGKKKRRTEVIRKVDNDWVVYPKKGGKRLGTHKTKKAALKQLAAIEINKAKSEGIREDSTRTTKKGGKGTLKRKMTRAGYGGKITISKLQKFKNRKSATAHDKAQANMVINFMRANRKK